MEASSNMYRVARGGATCSQGGQVKVVPRRLSPSSRGNWCILGCLGAHGEPAWGL